MSTTSLLEVGTSQVSPTCLFAHYMLLMDTPTAPSDNLQPERTKRALVEPVAAASKRTRLIVDSSANPSLVESSSSQTVPVPPPSFATRPTQPTNPAAPSIHPANRAAPLCAQNALLPSLHLGGSLPRPQPRPLGPRSSASTAPTVLDDPPHLPTPTPPPAPTPTLPIHSLPPPPRLQPAHRRASQPTAFHPPTPTPTAPRVPTIAAPRASASAAPHTRMAAPHTRTATPRAPAHPLPRETTPAPGVSRGASRWITLDDDELEPLPEPISQPQSRPAPRANAPSTSRAGRASTGLTRFNVDLGGAASPRGGARARIEVDRFSRDFGGPALGVPPRVRPYVPYTKLAKDRAEEFAAAEALVNGRQVVSCYRSVS